MIIFMIETEKVFGIYLRRQVENFLLSSTILGFAKPLTKLNHHIN